MSSVSTVLQTKFQFLFKEEEYIRLLEVHFSDHIVNLVERWLEVSMLHYSPVVAWSLLQFEPISVSSHCYWLSSVKKLKTATHVTLLNNFARNFLSHNRREKCVNCYTGTQELTVKLNNVNGTTFNAEKTDFQNKYIIHTQLWSELTLFGIISSCCKFITEHLPKSRTTVADPEIEVRGRGAALFCLPCRPLFLP